MLKLLAKDLTGVIYPVAGFTGIYPNFYKIKMQDSINFIYVL